MGKFEARKCNTCGGFWEAFIHRDELATEGSFVIPAGGGYVKAGPLMMFRKGRRCPGCASEDVQKAFRIPGDGGDAGPTISRNSERYPRFDRGLGVLLQSETHRKEVCRDKGLVPTEGGFDEDRYYGREYDEHDYWLGEYDKYCDDLENHPDFAGYREARDKGVFEDERRDRLAAAKQEAPNAWTA